jgi:ABC-2 type transport system ATP-binding protein
MSAISVIHLKKYFKVYRRGAGFLPAITSLFSRKSETVAAVDDISFEIRQGELVGFIGPNGAGKTTTLKCLSGLLWPSEGKIDVLGYKPFDKKSDFLKKISLVMGQKNQLWWDLPAVETFRLNKEIYELSEEKYKQNLDELTKLLDVSETITVPVRQLSLGQRMRMELIASLIHQPKVLFLDEPTIGLDVIMQKKMRDFIAEYNRKHNSTILLTSHYMADVKELCKRVIIIDHGKLIYDGDLAKLVEKYADTKIITIDVAKSVDVKEFTKFGKIKLAEEGKVIISVPKKNTTSVATTILKKYQIEDLNIEDPEIEDIIRLVFEKNKR